MATEFTPEIDAGLGLVFRLNFLWAKADREALSGRIDKWELVVDTIFRNLLYREQIEVKDDGNGGINGIALSKKDSLIWQQLKKNIKIIKIKKMIALKNKNIAEYQKLKLEHYHTIFLYDVWVRKFMHQELRLYMKEAESNPSMALFGGSFQKRGKK